MLQCVAGSCTSKSCVFLSSNAFDFQCIWFYWFLLLETVVYNPCLRVYLLKSVLIWVDRFSAGIEQGPWENPNLSNPALFSIELWWQMHHRRSLSLSKYCYGRRFCIVFWGHLHTKTHTHTHTHKHPNTHTHTYTHTHTHTHAHICTRRIPSTFLVSSEGQCVSW